MQSFVRVGRRMDILEKDTETYILLNGIVVKSKIELSEGIQLEPADTSHINFSSAIAACSQPDDMAVVAAFIPRVTSQFKISGESPRKTAINAWNSSWDALLLSAIFQTEVGFNIQSNITSTQISEESTLRAIHRYMTGFHDKPPYTLTSNDANWIAKHYSTARMLLDDDSFQTAVQCLSSYHWHPNPRIKLALLWAGIEGIFGAQSEIRFRLSIYLARFLSPDDEVERQRIFDLVKSLYGTRSNAVHGGKLKGNFDSAATDSANLLNRLIIKCSETGLIPKEADLVP